MPKLIDIFCKSSQNAVLLNYLILFLYYKLAESSSWAINLDASYVLFNKLRKLEVIEKD